MRRLTMVAVVATLLSSCAALLQNASSGQVGCHPGEITVSNERWDPLSSRWSAECRGRRYLCAAIPVGSAAGAGSGVTQVSCALDYQGPVPPGAAPGGCAYDTQCKGDRLCQQGVCVDPGQAPAQVAAPGSPSPPPAPGGPDPAIRRACLAEKLPDWTHASAIEKKAALDACPVPSASP